MSEEKIEIQSVGSQLCKKREQQQLSQDSVAGCLNLSIATIEALETDALDKLPSPSFTRGYLRAYAKLLGIDADSLIAIYNQNVPIDPKLMSINPIGNEARHHSPVIAWATLVIVLIMMALLGTWWYGWQQTEGDINAFELWPEKESVEAEQGTTEQNASQPDTTPLLEEMTKINREHISPESVEQPDAAPLQTVGSVRNGIVDNAKQIKTDTGIGTTGSADTEQTQQQDVLTNSGASGIGFIEQFPVVPASVNDTANKQKDSGEPSLTGTDTLQIQTESESWVEVFDAKGNRLMYDMLTSAKKRELRGAAPFLMFLGHTPGVSMIMNETLVKTPRYNQTNKTSRFTIDADGSLHQ